MANFNFQLSFSIKLITFILTLYLLSKSVSIIFYSNIPKNISKFHSKIWFSILKINTTCLDCSPCFSKNKYTTHSSIHYQMPILLLVSFPLKNVLWKNKYRAISIKIILWLKQSTFFPSQLISWIASSFCFPWGI